MIFVNQLCHHMCYGLLSAFIQSQLTCFCKLLLLVLLLVLLLLFICLKLDEYILIRYIKKKLCDIYRFTVSLF